jgi:nucleotide-binding universal stress UspA family protein
MFRSIVWATDGSEAADHALPLVERLGREPGATVTVVHDDEHLTGRARGHSVLADEPELAAKVRGQVAGLRDGGVEATFRLVRHTGGDPAEAIAEVARDVEADVIVVGTRGHGRITGALLGSVTQGLMHVAPCPVLAVPSTARVEPVERHAAATSA